MNKQQKQTTTSGEYVNGPQPFVPKGPKMEESDLPRLDTQARKVWDIMAGNSYPVEHTKRHGWWNLNQVAAVLGMPHSTVTACVRGFRNPENGGHMVDTRRETEKNNNGTWLYKLVPNTPEGVKLAKMAASAKKVRTDELLELKGWISQQVSAHGGWPANPFTLKIVQKIDEMVKERK